MGKLTFPVSRFVTDPCIGTHDYLSHRYYRLRMLIVYSPFTCISTEVHNIIISIILSWSSFCLDVYVYYDTTIRTRTKHRRGHSP